MVKTIGCLNIQPASHLLFAFHKEKYFLKNINLLINNGDPEASQVCPFPYHRSGEEDVLLVTMRPLSDTTLPPVVLLFWMFCSGKVLEIHKVDKDRTDISVIEQSWNK